MFCWAEHITKMDNDRGILYKIHAKSAQKTTERSVNEIKKFFLSVDKKYVVNEDSGGLSCLIAI